MSKKDENPKLSNTLLIIGIVLLIVGVVVALKYDWNREEEMPPNYDIHPIHAFDYSYGNNTWQFIDIRLPEEYLEGHVKNSTNINFHNTTTFYQEIGQLPKEFIYVIYDNEGSNNSIYVVEHMVDLEYPTVYNMQGGFIKWKESGIPWMIWGDL